MNSSQSYIVMGIIVLLIIVFFVFFLKNKKRRKLTPLSGLSLGFIISSMAFSDNRLLAYVLIGIGIILAVMDIVINKRNK